MSLVLGIDESGTGAWAGPFYVVGALVDNEAEFAEAVGGLNDSKKLSDARRRELVPRIFEHAMKIVPFIATVEMIREKGMRNVWREGIETIVRSFGKYTPAVYIDGPRDRRVSLPSGLQVTWEPKADGKYPSVMAASIVAKTKRNDDMIALAKDFPGYGWERNAGYGSDEHRLGIEKLGRTPQHRPINHTSNPVVEENILDLFEDS